MPNLTVRLLKGTNNIVRLRLSFVNGGVESTLPNLDNATGVVVAIGDTLIERLAGGEAGVDWVAEGAEGILRLDPANIPELVNVAVGPYPGYVRVFDPTHQQGQVFGAEGSVNRLRFDVSAPVD